MSLSVWHPDALFDQFYKSHELKHLPSHADLYPYDAYEFSNSLNWFIALETLTF